MGTARPLSEYSAQTSIPSRIWAQPRIVMSCKKTQALEYREREAMLRAYEAEHDVPQANRRLARRGLEDRRLVRVLGLGRLLVLRAPMSRGPEDDLNRECDEDYNAENRMVVGEVLFDVRHGDGDGSDHEHVRRELDRGVDAEPGEMAEVPCREDGEGREEQERGRRQCRYDACGAKSACGVCELG